MHSIIKQLHSLTPTMSMESVSLTDHLVAISGPMLLVYQKEDGQAKAVTAHVVTLVILVMYTLHHLLETITTVNRATQQIHLFMTTFTLKMYSGMASSVKASVAAMENLLHGSVWTYQTHQLMILRCAFAVV